MGIQGGSLGRPVPRPKGNKFMAIQGGSLGRPVPRPKRGKVRK